MSSPPTSTFGAYSLLRVLGRGGNGTAYLAIPLERGTLPSPLVIKLLHPDAAQDPLERARFEHEGKLAMTVELEALAKVYDVGVANETPYIAMELVQGMSLSRLLARLRERNAVLSVPQILKIAGSALAGVRELHLAKDQEGRALEAIHRDLSPRNLMLDRHGRVRILDLGMGRSRLRAQHTQTGVIVGTPGYMSPEQTLSGQITQRSDVYTLGVLFWELLTGKRYIAQGELAFMLTETVKRVFEPPSALRPGLPPQIDDVCRRALERDPQRRFASAAELEAEIEALQEARLDRMTAAPVVPLPEVYQLDLDAAELEHTLGTEKSTVREPVPLDTLVKIEPDTVVKDDKSDTLVKTRPETGGPARKRSDLLPLMVLALVLVSAVIGVLSALVIRTRREPTLVIPMDSDPAAPVSIRPMPDVRPRETAEELPREEEAPQKIDPKKPAPRRDPKPAITAPPAIEPTAEELMSRIHQLARATKQARPELAAEVDDLLNAGLFESATGDTPAVRARLREILEKLKANGEKRAAPPDR